MRSSENGIQTRNIVKNALAEDAAWRDITTGCLFKRAANIQARIVAKEPCVLAGIDVCQLAFKIIDKKISFRKLCIDSAHIRARQAVAIMGGNASSILRAERTALNFLSHLSAVATMTHKFVKAVSGIDVKILDTRKTLPNLRILEKYAVRAGGGFNHRFDLSSHILIKDNHINANEKLKKRRLADLVKEVKKKAPGGMIIEIEVDNLKQFKDVIEGRPDVIMLDNFNPGGVKQAVRLRDMVNRNVLIEVSGGITLNNVRRFALCRPDFISVGGITQSAGSIDFGMEVYEA